MTATVVLLLAASGALAQELFGWRVAMGPSATANATLFSSNVLSTGSRSIDYRPVLTLSCDRSRPAVWSQSVRMRSPLSGSGSVPVSVSIDGRGDVRENWLLAQKNRALQLDGEDGVSRIAEAGRMRVRWRIGFFSGDGEAVFSLAGIGDTLAALAADCGVPVPER